MYQHSYIIPNNSTTMYRNNVNGYGTYANEGDRFFFAPFLVGGLAGTALGYGLANNNQINRPCCGGMQPVFIQPYPVQYQQMYQQPYGSFSSTSTNNFYN